MPPLDFLLTPPGPVSEGARAGFAATASAIHARFPSLLGCVVIGLVAGPIYAEGLTRWPLWEDEQWTHATTTGPVSGMFRMLAQDLHPPLFFLVERIFVRVLSGEAALRAFPALCALATALAVHVVVRRRLGAGAAWAAGLLAALLPFVVAAAGTARAGTFMALEGAGMLLASFSLAEGPAPRRAALTLAVLGAAGLYTHYAMGWAFAGAAAGAAGGILAAGGLTRAEKRERLWWLLAALGAAALVFAPWAAGPMRRQWAAIVNNDSHLDRDLDVLRYLLWPVGRDFVHWGAYPVLLAATVGAVSLCRRGPNAGVVLGWTLAAIAVPWAFSNNAFAAGRTYLYAGFLPCFCLCAGHGLLRIAAALTPVALRPALAGLAGASSLLACAPGVWLLWKMPGSPVAISPTPSGIYDPGFEADFLAGLRVRGRSPTFVSTESLGAWLRYRPELLSQGPERAWVASARREARSEGWAAAAASPCVFGEAFSRVVVAPDPRGCAVLLDAITAAAEQYGPFQFELAARERDPVAALALARKAGRAMPCSLAADELAAAAFVAQGRAPLAIPVLEGAAWKAAQTRPGEVTGLLVKARRLAELSGMPLEQARLARSEACAGRYDKDPLLPLCLTPLASVLW